MSNVITILSALKEKGIILSLDDSKQNLKLKGNLANLSPEEKEQLRNNKDEIIRFFLDNDNRQSKLEKIAPAPLSKDYPLSDEQRRLWIISQFEGGSESYNMPYRLEFKEALDINSFQKAINAVIERHESLRTVFRLNEDGEPRQIVLSSDELAFTVDFKDCRSEDPSSVDAYIQQDSFLPFDLENGPLIRATLFRAQDENYVFYYNLHHIICDGWSISVLSKDLFTFYKSFIVNEEPTLAHLNIQYKDYANWQLSRQNSEEFHKQLDYWKKQLEGELPVLRLPGMKPFAKEQSNDGISLSTFLDRESTAKLKEFAHANGGTLFMGLLACWKVLFYKYTGNKDIILGSPVAGRNHPDLENQIGFYVNTLAFRTLINGDSNFSELYRQIKEQTLQSYQNQQVSFDKLVEELEIVRDTNRNAIFDVMLVLQNLDQQQEAIVFSDELLQITNDGLTKAKFDLQITMSEVEDFLSLNIIFKSEVYEQELIENLIKHFRLLVKNLLDQPNEKIGNTICLTKEELHTLRVDFNGSKEAYPEGETIIDLLEEQVRIHPSKIAISFENRELSYLELNTAVNKMAAYLKDKYAIESDAKIAFELNRDEWMIITLIAIVKAGAAYVPIDPAYPDVRKQHMLQDSDCKVCITEETLAIIKQEMQAYGSENSESKPKPSDLVYIIYTSGSTGTPKGVMMEHHCVYNLIREHAHFGIDHQKVSQFTSISFDVSFQEIFFTLAYGGELHVLSEETKLNPSLLSEYVKTHQLTTLFLPTSYFKFLATHEEQFLNGLPSVKDIVVAGEQLVVSEETFETLRKAEIKLHNHYGPAETHVVTTYCIDPNSNSTYQSIPPIGKPIANTDVYIVDEYLNLVPVGVFGTLYLAGTAVSRGYHNRPDLTAERFIADSGLCEGIVYKTGDIARWLPDGNIEFSGRNDDQVKIRGYRVEIGEVEHKIRSLEPIDQVVVINKVNQNNENELIAYYTSKITLSHTELRSQLSELLADYMIPTYFIQLEQIRLNQNGKVDRKSLPAPDAYAALKHKAFVEPKSELEHEMVRIWQKILGKESIGLTDDFFELGGHSLKVIRLMNEYAKAFNVKPGMKELFANSSLVSQIHLIQSSAKQRFDSIPKVPYAASYPLSDSQKRLWILSQFDGGSAAYNMPSTLVLDYAVDREKFFEAIRFTVARHEVLRTVFQSNQDGEPGQVVIPVNQFAFQIEYLDYTKEADKQKAVFDYVQHDSYLSFDLENGPLFRACLIQTETESSVFYFNMHHIISDGWSMKILARDVMTYYEALLNGKPVLLPELKIQYRDYAAWQLKQVESEDFATHKNYWTEKLSGELPALDLPANKTRPSVQTYNGLGLSTYIDAETTQRLKQFVATNGGTLFMGILAGWNLLLGRYSGSKDIILGTPIAGRDHVDLDDQIGFYVNTLILRSTIDDRKDFTEYYATTVKETLNAFQHQDYPFDRLISDINSNRDISRNVVFDVLLSLQNTDENTAEIQLTKEDFTTISNNGVKTCKFDLDIILQEVGDCLSMNVTFNTDVYEEQMIGGLIRHYKNLLKYILNNAESPLFAIDFLSDEEREKLLFELNETTVNYPQDKTFVAYFEEWAEKTPDKVALHFENTALTYRELNEKVNRLAACLKSDYHIQPDELVSIKLQRSDAMLISMLAVLKAGAAYVPIDPSYPQTRIAYIEQASRSKLVIDNEKYASFDLQAFPADNPEKADNASNLAYVIFTSGSTGNPKGVMIEHRSLMNFMFGMKQRIPLTEEDHFLAITSISFDISILELLWSLFSGITVTIKPDNTAINNLNTYVSDFQEVLNFSLFYFSSQNEDTQDKYRLLKESVLYADKHEFSAVWLPERHFHEFGSIFPNPSVLAAGLSTITQNIEIRSGSVVLPLHDVIRVAEEWSVVDNLSNGRVALSIASGWHADDFVLQPDNYRNRQEKMYSQIADLKTLWSGQKLTRKNGLDQEIDIQIYPKPLNPNLEIYVTSGGNEETFRSAGAIGANILTHLLGQELSDLEKNIKVYKQALAENGFDVDKGKIALMLHTYIGEELDAVKALVKEPFKDYLRSSVSLIKNLAKDVDLSTISESDLNDILEIGFDRYWQSAALLGTYDSCQKILSDIYAIGVTEIACLVDFGIPENEIVKGLDNLNRLKNKYQKAEQIRENQLPITSLQITPSYLDALLDDQKSNAFIQSLNNIIVGGEAFSSGLAARLRNATDAKVHLVYGPTETTIWSTYREVTEDQVTDIGKPIQNTQIYILDENNQLCPVGVKGELCIGGHGLARGYYQDETLTASKFVDLQLTPDVHARIYKTGDVAKWSPDGMLVFLGRIDNQVKINGFRIELGEIENAIDNYKAVSQAIVVAVKNENNSKSLVAFFTAESTIDQNEIKRHVQGILPHYMVPHQLVQIDEFPLTPNGKIDRKALLTIDFKSTEKEYIPPGNEIESLIAAIWANTLGLAEEKIGINANFFDLGGNSLLLIKMLNAVNKQFNVEIPLIVAFGLPSVQALAEHLSQNASNESKEEENLDELFNTMEESYNLLNMNNHEE